MTVVQMNNSLIWAAFLVVIIFVPLFFYAPSSYRRSLLCGSFLGIILALIRACILPSTPLFYLPSSLASSHISFTGTVLRIHSVEPTSVTYRVSVDGITTHDYQHISFDGDRVFLVTERALLPHYLPSDIVHVKGKLSIVTPHESSYFAFLHARGIDATVAFASIHLSGRDSSIFLSLMRTLEHTHQAILSRMFVLLPFPHSALFSGMLLGDDGLIPAHIATEFRRTGVTHILAVSGSNVTLLLNFLFPLFFFLPLRFRVYPLMFGVIFFTLLVGADPPIIRASIMGILGLLALLTHRIAFPLISLLVAASGMVLWNPPILLFDPGFQLSILATFGIITLAPRLANILSFVPSTLTLRTSLSTTLAAFLCTLPVTVLQFHQLSLVSLLTNLLIAPLIAPALLAGIAIVVLSVFSLSLASLLSPLVWVLFELILRIVHYTALVPFASVSFQM